MSTYGTTADYSKGYEDAAEEHAERYEPLVAACRAHMIAFGANKNLSETAQAIEKALQTVPESGRMSLDATAYPDDDEGEEERARSYVHTPDKCPSMHWNDGTDTCADCGEDLNPPTHPAPPVTTSPLSTYSVLLAWGQEDEGEYHWSGQASSKDAAIAGARMEMWASENAEDYEEGEEIPAEDVPEYEIKAVEEGANIWAAPDMLEALRAALPYVEFHLGSDDGADAAVETIKNAIALGEGRA